MIMICPKSWFQIWNTLHWEEKAEGPLWGSKVEPAFPTEWRQVLGSNPENKINYLQIEYCHESADISNVFKCFVFCNKVFLILLCPFKCLSFPCCDFISFTAKSPYDQLVIWQKNIWGKMLTAKMSTVKMLTVKMPDTYRYIEGQFSSEKSVHCVLSALRNHFILMK